MITNNRNSWAFFSHTEIRSGGGRYQSLSEFPVILPQDDDGQYVVRQGDRCDSLALQFYGESRLWWVFMVRNKLSDPLTDIVPGKLLIVPSTRYVRDSLLT